MTKSCEHLQYLTEADFPSPKRTGACEECLVEGTHGAALREWRVCGHIGCCDSAPGWYATRHFRDSEHPVMRSVTLGERWIWRNVHETYGRLTKEGFAQ